MFEECRSVLRSVNFSTLDKLRLVMTSYLYLKSSRMGSILVGSTIKGTECELMQVCLITVPWLFWGSGRCLLWLLTQGFLGQACTQGGGGGLRGRSNPPSAGEKKFFQYKKNFFVVQMHNSFLHKFSSNSLLSAVQR